MLAGTLAYVACPGRFGSYCAWCVPVLGFYPMVAVGVCFHCVLISLFVMLTILYVDFIGLS